MFPQISLEHHPCAPTAVHITSFPLPLNRLAVPAHDPVPQPFLPLSWPALSLFLYGPACPPDAAFFHRSQKNFLKSTVRPPTVIARGLVKTLHSGGQFMCSSQLSQVSVMSKTSRLVEGKNIIMNKSFNTTFVVCRVECECGCFYVGRKEG